METVTVETDWLDVMKLWRSRQKVWDQGGEERLIPDEEETKVPLTGD